MKIRRVKREDMEDFVEVYLKSYEGLEEYAYRTRKDVKWYFRWLFSRDKDGFIVAEVDSKIVGFVACDTNWFSIFEMEVVGEVHEIVVLPDYRFRGIGSRLLREALLYALQKERKLAELFVGKNNYVAKKFYRENGFEEVGEIGKWIRMIKKLDPREFLR
ncbi:MAG: GNAT family N-acetyltransferase [Archaeoglobaceae archaeon]|nr:GNAT family N-acetyltransferase [Archaeoglobaceae archaeon]MCX8151746.1 GNAT family N-acetyltransferase [Archaeoglobaceae archaeon]MDW8014284.1 GNAT family N-acetyltransferase [Archaeoglobaceae archaeon]